uniref:Uncharacterized protein n=1 Tax=Oryza meridionalis TaxID=40149 RepID=A0A0E0E3S8_9ORYZ
MGGTAETQEADGAGGGATEGRCSRGAARADRGAAEGAAELGAGGGVMEGAMQLGWPDAVARLGFSTRSATYIGLRRSRWPPPRELGGSGWGRELGRKVVVAFWRQVQLLFGACPARTAE